MWAFARSALAPLALIAALLAVPALAVPALAGAAPTAAELARATSAAGWLKGAQRTDGGLPLDGGDVRRVNAWAALGLAAATVNARDVAVPGGRTLFALLERQAPLVSETLDYARFLLAAQAVGADGQPHVGGVDLVGGILGAQLRSGGGAFAARPGAVTPDVQATAFAALALRLAEGPQGGPISRRAADGAASWLLGAQNLDGSWPAEAPGATAPGDTETTAAAIEALAATLAFPPGSPSAHARSRALGWLQGRLNADGGLGSGAPGAASDVRATAGVVRALVACGIDSHDFTTGGRGPLHFLAAAQDRSGRVGPAAGSGGAEPVVTTAYATLALTGTSLPFGPIPRGDGSGRLPVPGPPAGLPTGPLLPIVQAPLPVPVAPIPPAPQPQAPVFRTPPPAHAPARAGDGIERVRPRRERPARRPARRDGARERDGGAGSGAGGPGSGGLGGGAGDGGTVSTPGAPDRAGGGGGAAGGTATVAVAATGAGPALPDRRRGGRRLLGGDARDRAVTGTLIGREAPTEGASGSAAAVPGSPGSGAGDRAGPWWAVGIAVALALSIAAGMALDRRPPAY
ncbi:prenyltransferase/squalene oxidase repeat-containing protein [Conexibacter woesei]|uniref:Squalene cyclase C-terminal domain-containing protein n=1 Tax=Conexibacter woesei (strain DSM 14684 / CCUG 47730 / CIP 108061 / JCM 11494 / NBRC 100937 / ID131577) TaxID=469383 RepID=D3F168_CONWI|nr:hypothetical protein [Conexibacter woesei]ADB50144.1 hypothetical protein Cwoe_1717 [Conexibacter woesei DSM 14684]